MTPPHTHRQSTRCPCLPLSIHNLTDPELPLPLVPLKAFLQAGLLEAQGGWHLHGTENLTGALDTLGGAPDIWRGPAPQPQRAQSSSSPAAPSSAGPGLALSPRTLPTPPRASPAIGLAQNGMHVGRAGVPTLLRLSVPASPRPPVLPSATLGRGWEDKVPLQLLEECRPAVSGAAGRRGGEELESSCNRPDLRATSARGSSQPLCRAGEQEYAPRRTEGTPSCSGSESVQSRVGWEPRPPPPAPRCC